jgi:hypothetical protein
MINHKSKDDFKNYIEGHKSEKFARGASCRTTICLTGNWSLGCQNVFIANIGDVMNTRSPPIFVHQVQTDEVLCAWLTTCVGVLQEVSLANPLHEV